MTPPDRTRLIEIAFPLKQASIDSVHEKNVRHGHISTLHIWPARRPLAACRRRSSPRCCPTRQRRERDCLRKLGGRNVKKRRKKCCPTEKSRTMLAEETEGGILHWGRESGPDLAVVPRAIREAYGGRAPKVLDPFAGGGAIPLEAMRLGCEATAIDLNPVAWFILKCTLEYPQKLAGQKRRLPDFILWRTGDFMRRLSFEAQDWVPAKAAALPGSPGCPREDEKRPHCSHHPQRRTSRISLEADLAWHVRAWGKWVLREARGPWRGFTRLTPAWSRCASRRQATKVSLEGVKGKDGGAGMAGLHLCPLGPDGTVDISALNAEFDAAYLAEKHRPRWVPKPTVAYLWARTVACKQCRAVVPLLKTRWLCKKDDKRVLLTMAPDASRSGVVFGLRRGAEVGGNTAQRREHDRRAAPVR